MAPSRKIFNSLPLHYASVYVLNLFSCSQPKNKLIHSVSLDSPQKYQITATIPKRINSLFSPKQNFSAGQYLALLKEGQRGQEVP